MNPFRSIDAFIDGLRRKEDANSFSAIFLIVALCSRVSAGFVPRMNNVTSSSPDDETTEDVAVPTLRVSMRFLRFKTSFRRRSNEETECVAALDFCSSSCWQEARTSSARAFEAPADQNTRPNNSILPSTESLQVVDELIEEFRVIAFNVGSLEPLTQFLS